MPQPHDSLFFAAFGSPEDAEGLLRALLPQEATAAIDWSSLQRATDAFKEVGKTAAHVDLLFCARFRDEPGTIYFLLEHKSYDDPGAVLQCLRYAVRIQARHRREHPEDPLLPVVLPGLIHHGPRHWNAPLKLATLTGGPQGFHDALGEHLLSFSVLLEDLTGRSDRELAALASTDRALLGLHALRDVRNTADVPDLFRGLRDLLHRLAETSSGAEFLSSFFLYVTQVLDLPGDELRAIIHTELRPSQEDQMASTYDQIFGSGVAKGISQGISQGIAQGRIESILVTLRARFGDVPAPIERAVESASPDRLVELVARAAIVERIEELLLEDKATE